VPNSNELDFAIFGPKLRDGIECAVNLIDRSFPSHARVFGLQPFLLLTARNVQATYRTILHLCAERQDDPRYRCDYAVSALPLARNLADSLTNAAFVLADPQPYIRWYWASGWRGYKLNVERHLARARPEEASWAAQQTAALQEAINRWNIPAQWAADPRRCIPWWPTLGKLARQCLHDDQRALFAYLNDWFYALMSSASHGTPPGLRHGAMILLLGDDQREIEFERMRAAIVFNARVPVGATRHARTEDISSGVHLDNGPTVLPTDPRIVRAPLSAPP
jgi:hypothetical protein